MKMKVDFQPMNVKKRHTLTIDALDSLLAGSKLCFGRHIGRVKVGRSGTSVEYTACGKTSLFSGQKVKSLPPADGVPNWSSRCQKSNDVLFDRQSWSRKRTTDVKRALSRALSKFREEKRLF